MAKSLRPLGIALALIILLSASLNITIPNQPALAAVENPDTRCQIVLADSQDEGSQQLGLEGVDLEQELPIMKPSPETRKKWVEDYKKAPKVHINEKIKLQLEQTPVGGSLSLLSHLQYTPGERSQGSCGNCWAWAGTGVMEIALDVQNGIKDRLSMQYLNSNYNGGSGTGWACCGGWIDDVANFYTGTGRAIPWSNTNASYQDGSRTCGSGSTSLPAGNISTTPSYPITSITAQSITTQGVSQATAIANIKNILNQNKAIFFGFLLPTGADWSNFRNFWYYQPETAIWDPDFSCGHTWDAGGGGHAVLCVGYNDDDPNPANHYWLMVNSWGTAGGNRPNGLFRLAMDMNYSCQDSVGDYTFYWQTLNTTFQNPSQTQRLIGVAPDTTSAGGGGGCTNVMLQRFQATASGDVTEFKVKVSASGNVKVAVYADSSNSPGALLRANNSSTPVISGWNTIAITPSVAVTSGNHYWLAVVSDSCNLYYHSSDASANTIWKPSTYSSWIYPDPAGSGWNTQTGYTYFIAAWGTITPPTPPNPPDPISPGAAIILKWGAPNGATKYQLQVSTSSSFTTTVFDADVGNNTSQEVTGLSFGTIYYWRVRAGNIGGWSNWSTTISFTVNQVP
jgi:hypothetical protein